MTDIQANDAINKLYIQAQEFRAFAEQLEINPNNVKACMMWHNIADSLFDAVNEYDTQGTIKEA